MVGPLKFPALGLHLAHQLILRGLGRLGPEPPQESHAGQANPPELKDLIVTRLAELAGYVLGHANLSQRATIQE